MENDEDAVVEEGPGVANENEGQPVADNANDVDEQEALALANAFGWGADAVEILDNFVFDGFYQAERSNCIYQFSLENQQIKTFRYPAYQGGLGYVDRYYQVHLELGIYYMVCNPGDELHVQSNAVGETTTVIVIASDQIQQQNVPIFSHIIPLILPDTFSVGMLCKAGCRYYVRAIDQDNVNDQQLLNNNLALPEQADQQVVVNDGDQMIEMPMSTTYELEVVGNANDIANWVIYNVFLVVDEGWMNAMDMDGVDIDDLEIDDMDIEE